MNAWFALPIGVALAAGAAPAQVPGAKSRPSAGQLLVDRLRNGDPRGRAMGELLSLRGEAARDAAKRLAGALDFRHRDQAREFLLALEEMGPAATGALDLLWTKAKAAKPEEARQIYHAITGISRFMPTHVERATCANRAKKQLHALMVRPLDEGGNDRARKLAAESWFRSVQLSMGNKLSLNVHTQIGQLETLLRNKYHYAYMREWAAMFLGLQGKAASGSAKELARILTTEPWRPGVSTGAAGIRIRYSCGPRSHRRIALALSRIQEQGPLARQAHAYLLLHGMNHERWAALAHLRKAQVADEPVLAALAKVSADGATTLRLRCEAVTTLGMFGGAARKHTDLLGKLAKSTTKRLANIAKAALRSIGKD